MSQLSLSTPALLEKRQLGRTLEVSAIGFGAMGLSEFYGTTDDKTSLQLLQQVVEQGVTLIDTADMYGRGHNEQLIGHLLSQLSQQQRAQLHIATKCGIERSQTDAYARNINNSPAYIHACCDASLKRLGLEQISLYYLHRLDPERPIEETMQVLADLKQQGKIAHVGLCEVSADILQRAHAVLPIDVVQTEYSLWTRDIEQSLLPLLAKLNIGLVAYSPLGRGFLTGKYLTNQQFEQDDFRQTNPRFSDENLPINKKLIDALLPLSEKYQCTTGQLALAWLLAQSPNIVPIPGTKQKGYLLENIAASQITLSAEDLLQMNALKNHIVIQGDRYTQEGMKGIKA